MRFWLALAVALAPSVTHAEPRLIGAGDVGTWPEAGFYQGRHEVHVGAEADVEQAVTKYVWLGGGLDLQRVWYTDDECFGFHGWRGDANATAVLDVIEASSPEIHVLLGARAGLALLRRAPYCVARPQPVATNHFGYDIGGMLGFDVARRWRIQVVVTRAFLGQPNEPVEVALGFGYVLR